MEIQDPVLADSFQAFITAVRSDGSVTLPASLTKAMVWQLIHAWMGDCVSDDFHPRYTLRRRWASRLPGNHVTLFGQYCDSHLETFACHWLRKAGITIA